MTLFLSRVTGSENRLSRLRKLKSLTQKAGEQIRQFAIRVRDELQRIRGKEPTDQEWRDGVMVGALDATAMELDRVANQSPGKPDFWEVIKAVEFWERQHAALLNQGDPMSAIRRSSAGAAVLFGDPGVAGKDPSSSALGVPKGDISRIPVSGTLVVRDVSAPTQRGTMTR